MTLLTVLARKGSPEALVDPEQVARELAQFGYELFEINLAYITLKESGYISEQFRFNDLDNRVRVIDITPKGAAWVRARREQLKSLTRKPGASQ
jgi:hypothetical protein